MLIAGFIAISAYFLNIGLIGKFAVIGAGIALFATELALILVNILTGAKNLDYINYKSLAKTFICVCLLGLTSFWILDLFTCNSIVKLILYSCLYILACTVLRKRILS